jgi:ribokinase
VLDAAPATQIPDDLIRLADIVTVNGEEAGMLSGVDVHDRDSAVASARAIHARGARHVSVGIAEGRAVVSDAKEHWLPSHRVAVVDTTGAGDACAAGIAIALGEGRSFFDACVLGHAAAVLSSTVLGARASLPFRANVDALLKATREG